MFTVGDGRRIVGQFRIMHGIVDGIDAESWYNRAITPHDRAVRHEQYESYLMEEVVPLMRVYNGYHSDFLMTTGCSFGAYHAANLAFKHPDVFSRVIAISGQYDLHFLIRDGFDDACYFNSPMSYLPNLGDEQKSDLSPSESPRGIFYFRSRVRIADVTDGLSQTAFFSEKIRGRGLPDPKTDMLVMGVSSSLDQTYQTCNALPPTALPLTSRQGMTWVMGEMCCTTYNHVAPPNARTCPATALDMQRRELVSMLADPMKPFISLLAT